ncbi:MAG: hypothetical protein ABFC89_12725 [Methanospirillum sp.]
MDWIRRAIEAGERTPADIAELREAFRKVLREEGLPVRDRAGGSVFRPTRGGGERKP